MPSRTKAPKGNPKVGTNASKVHAPTVGRTDQLRQPRLAELVASSLRADILSGSLGEGDTLPRQDDLLETFGVSPPAVREALRILETEGLIRVRRGNVGGAIVHAPSASGVAYMVSLVLQTWGTQISDVGNALRDMEPVCTALCARRKDRKRTLVPRLRKLVAEQEQAIDDTLAYISVSRRFHETLVSECGSDSLKVVVGALEAVWSSHERHVYTPGPEPTKAVRRAALKAHERLVDAIESGDEAVVVALARRHLEATQTFTMRRDGRRTVTADLVRSADHSAPG